MKKAISALLAIVLLVTCFSALADFDSTGHIFNDAEMQGAVSALMALKDAMILPSSLSVNAMKFMDKDYFIVDCSAQNRMGGYNRTKYTISRSDTSSNWGISDMFAELMWGTAYDVSTASIKEACSSAGVQY